MLFDKIRNFYLRYQLKGFIGPKYKGFYGKFKLYMQSWTGHVEIVSCAKPGTWKMNPEKLNPRVRIEIIERFDESMKYLEEMSRAYHRDFRSDWERYFSWGQVLCVALLEGKLASFGWIQDGRKRARCHYVRLSPGEYRLTRAGVLPGFRNQNVHTTRHALMLSHLFTNGATRVYVDAFADNEYSWKGHFSAGYQEFGRVFVRKTITGKEYIRWL
jgi:hypothetical protein